MTWLMTNVIIAAALTWGLWLCVICGEPRMVRRAIAIVKPDRRKRAAYCRAVVRDFDERGIVDSGAPLPR